jgi:hypothetical protein
MRVVMTADEYSTEMELYGVSPGLIAIIMFMIGVLVPYGYLPRGLEMFGGYWSETVIYSLLWVYQSAPYISTGLRVFPLDLIFTLPLCALNILYARWIVKFYQSESTRYSTVVIGLLSLILPSAIIFYVSGLFGHYIVLYPIPIQFILGLLILWKIKEPEVISPWSGMRLDLSLWKWPNRSRGDDWDSLEREKEMFHRERSMEDE